MSKENKQPAEEGMRNGSMSDSDDYSDDLRPVKAEKHTEAVNGRSAKDPHYEDEGDFSYSDESLLSQERSEGKTLNHTNSHSSTMSDTRGPRVLDFDEELRFYANPIDDNVNDPSLSTKTVVKTQDIRSLVSNQNRLLDNLGDMKRDIGNLDKEIDSIRSQIRSKNIIKDTSGSTQSGSSSSVSPKRPSVGGKSSLRKSTSLGNLSNLPSSTLTTFVPSANTYLPKYTSLNESSIIPMAETNTIRYTVSTKRTPIIGGTSLGGVRTKYVPGSYTSGLSSSRYDNPIHAVRSTSYKETPFTTLRHAGANLTYTPVGTITVTTEPQVHTRVIRRPAHHLDDWDSFDDPSLLRGHVRSPATYELLRKAGSIYRAPHITSISNRVFNSHF